MPICCRCNGKGRCVNCTCVKSGSACSNCLPLRKGNCANLATRTTPHAARTTPHETAGPTLAGPASTAPQPTSHIDDANATLSSQPAISIEGLGPVSDNHTPLQESPTPLPNNHFPHLEPQTTPNPFVVNNHNNHPGDAATEHSPASATPDCADSLPPHATLSATPFRWGEVPSHIFSSDIASAYEEQVLWHKNIFSPPTGHAGTEYVKEHTRLLRAYKDKTPLERIALQAIMVMPGLLLQKPYTKAGYKEFNKHLSRRLTLWKAGKIRELLDEARTIQSRLPDQDSCNGPTSHKLNRRFAALVSKGNIHAAISLITEYNKGGVLELTPEVRSALQAKHPKAQPAHPEVLLHGELPTINPILFESITSDTVRRSALATQGSAGPSMADSYIW